MNKLLLIYRASRLIYSPASIKNIIYRAKFYFIAYCNRHEVVDFLSCKDNEFLERELIDQPDKLGVLIWPYIHKNWRFTDKVNAIESHYRLIKEVQNFNVRVGEKYDLIELNEFLDGLKITVDRGKWFQREGELVLNIIYRSVRVYSLAFTISDFNNEKVLFIGGIQGVTIDNVMEIYKSITKALFGMRPKDFLLNILKYICKELNIGKILAISDNDRHHKSDYFKGKEGRDNFINYDSIWKEQNGICDDNGFYSIPVEINKKPIEDIVSKKRSMYKKRYALLDDVEKEISEKLFVSSA